MGTTVKLDVACHHSLYII